MGLPRWLIGENLPANARDSRDEGSGVRKIPGEGNGNPLQYSCLENPTDRGAWQATVHGVTKNRTRLKRLNMHTQLRKEKKCRDAVLVAYVRGP